MHVVGPNKGDRVPYWIGGDDEFALAQVEAFPKKIFFLAELGDTNDDDIYWLNDLSGPDWNCDIDSMEGLMGSAGDQMDTGVGTP